MRVLISGMGGQLGTLVAQRLEVSDSVETVSGYDIDPPRRRLRRAVFRRLNPRDVAGLADFVDEVDPTVVVHLGVYEPHARLTPAAAVDATAQGAEALVAALERRRGLETVVVRSGIEVYGRRRGGPVLPDESASPDPTCEFGRSQLAMEQSFVSFGERHGTEVALLRVAPVVGSHTPSPLGRLLRLGVVPVPAMAEPTFTLLHAEDASTAICAAIRGGVSGPVNVVAPGAVSAVQAARLGGRIPVPLVGPGWHGASWLSEMAGAPLPDHVRELLTRGRCADGTRCASVLGFTPQRPVVQIIAEVHDFATVEFLPVAQEPAA